MTLLNKLTAWIRTILAPQEETEQEWLDRQW